MKIKPFIGIGLLLNISISYAFENFDQAFDQMRHRYSLGHYKRIMAIAPEALKLSQNQTQKYQVLYYEGLALDGLLNFWQAEQIFAKAAGIEGISPQQQLQARYNQIKSQYSNQHFTSALANVEKYSKFSGKPSELHLNILLIGAEAARQSNQKTKALALAETISKIALTDSAWYYRGIIMQIQILCLMQNYGKAEQIINKVKIKKIPLQMYPEFLAWSGFCYEKDKKYKLAGKFYAQASDSSPTYYSGLATLRYGNLLNRDGKNHKLAAIEYKKVLNSPQANSQHKSQAIYKLAMIYKEQKPELAMHFLSRIDNLKSPSAYWQAKIYNLHGDILYKEGKVNMAKKYFQACLNLSNNLPDSKLYASEIITQIGKKKILPEKQ